MELRHEGYGALLITDDGARVSLNPREVMDFLTELPEFAADFLMTDDVLEAFGETALVDSLMLMGAEVHWPNEDPE